MPKCDFNKVGKQISMHVLVKMLKCEYEVFLTKTVPIQKAKQS